MNRLWCGRTEPLSHSSCYILKLHGDYKDARILNTDEELGGYGIGAGGGPLQPLRRPAAAHCHCPGAGHQATPCSLTGDQRASLLVGIIIPQNVRLMAKGRTVCIIAHRLASLTDD